MEVVKNMKAAYEDITKRLGSPLWYDEHGVPRYEAFRPRLCANIYAVEALFLEISCQDCGKRFGVAMTWTHWGSWASWTEVIEERGQLPHYGDPPRHDCVGDTMNCIDERVLEFWQRGKGALGGWRRVKRLEVSAKEAEALAIQMKSKKREAGAK